MKYSLKQCVWEITLACCFSCKYCGSSGGRARHNELTTAEALDVADQLIEIGCKRVNLIGGEVFMRPDWRDIILRLTSAGVRVTIITNGFLFTDDIISSLKELNIESIAISLDAPEEIHDKYRQPGSYKRAIQAIKTLTDNDFLVSVISTLNSENVNYLDDMFDILKEYPIMAWQLQACSPMGNASNAGLDFRFDAQIPIDFVTKHIQNPFFIVGIADNIGYYTEAEGYLRGSRTEPFYFVGCQAGLTTIGIDSVGNVRGCESLYDECFNEGNLRERSLRDIWEDPDSFSYNRKFTSELLTGKCSTCKMGEYCAGGCRSYNYFVHKKMYESPHCARKQNN